MGHLARASAVALALKDVANPIIVSMAGGIAEIPSFMGIRCEYIPGRDRMWMSREKWDVYLRDRLLALVEETGAKVLSFDGVVPYPGVIAAKNANPNLKLVWVRRGLWQKKPQRFILGLQAKMMDKIIEPGDIARAYDFGPTSKRKDSVLTSPVSLFRKEDAMSRDDARRALGLDLNRPTVLVQLGTGEGDVNEKMTAALSGLLGWKDLQVILTKAPVDKDGNSLAPEGLDLKVARYFPLAKVLHAFDAGICATGYNGVHELLPAQLPTVFVSNIRGTDDQEARARWCHDFGFALRADQDLDPDWRSKRIGLAMNLPLWDWRGGPVGEAAARLSQSDNDLAYQELSLVQSLEAAYQQYDIANAQVVALEGGIVRHAANALRIAELAYKAGEKSFLDVMDAQRVYRAARNELITAQFELASAWAEIERLRASAQ